jgi:hypothetical protein
MSAGWTLPELGGEELAGTLPSSFSCTVAVASATRWCPIRAVALSEHHPSDTIGDG